MEKNIFETLNKVNCNEHTEQKNGLTYLSWAWAWAELMKLYPDASYEIVHWDGKPYLYDENLGYMCETKITINGQTREMWLPVMDGANKAMKAYEQTFKSWNRFSKTYEEKTIAAATMFDINKTIMRCLVKNIGIFGLGLYIYAGEDLPEVVEETQQDQDGETSAVSARRKAAGRGTKKSNEIHEVPQEQAPAEPAPSYQPLSDDDYWKIVKGYAEGRKAKDGSDLKDTWILKTHAGWNEVAQFDNHVANYKAVNNLQ